MCQFKVWDATTRRHRNCKKKSAMWKGPCHVHGWKFASKIQATWRMYRTRNLVNRFKHIGDPWSLVLKHLKFHNNKDKLYKSHRRIYQNRAEDLGTTSIMLCHNLLTIQRERMRMPLRDSFDQEVYDLVAQEEANLSLRFKISENKRWVAKSRISWTNKMLKE